MSRRFVAESAIFVRLDLVGGVPPYTETIGYVGRGLKIFRWLESRGTFLEASQKANFPEVISASIESVPLFDLELGAISPVRTQGPESPAFSELRCSDLGGLVKCWDDYADHLFEPKRALSRKDCTGKFAARRSCELGRSVN